MPTDGHLYGDAFIGVVAVHQKHAQQDNAHEFLSVLGSVHEAHTGRAEDLGALKEAFCLGPFRLAEHGDDQLAHQITQAEAHDYGDDKSIEDLHPFSRIHAA